MNNLVFFIVGPSGVGKTFFANKIRQKYNITFFDTGPILRKYYSHQHLTFSFGEWIQSNEKKYGDNFAISCICKAIQDSIEDNSIIIITGNRCIAGINYMVDFFSIKKYFIIYLDASYKCIKDNIEKREDIKLNNEEFNSIINGDISMGLGSLKQYVLSKPDECFYFYKKNNSDFNCENKFASILEKIGEVNL